MPLAVELTEVCLVDQDSEPYKSKLIIHRIDKNFFGHLGQATEFTKIE